MGPDFLVLVPQPFSNACLSNGSLDPAATLLFLNLRPFISSANPIEVYSPPGDFPPFADFVLLSAPNLSGPLSSLLVFPVFFFLFFIKRLLFGSFSAPLLCPHLLVIFCFVRFALSDRPSLRSGFLFPITSTPQLPLWPVTLLSKILPGSPPFPPNVLLLKPLFPSD